MGVSPGVAAMSFGNLGFTEILLVAVVLLLLFGARRLPEIGRSLGKGIMEFKKSVTTPDDDAKLGSGEAGQVEAPPKLHEEAK